MSYIDGKFRKEFEIRNLRVEPCLICGGESALLETARVNSLHFANFIYVLLRCENSSCHNYGWVAIDTMADTMEKIPLRLLIAKETKPPHRILLPHKIAINNCLDLPENVFHDFGQAYQCLLSGFYDAAVCIARRALERVLVEKGAKYHDNIPKMIKQLEERGKIPPETSSLCDDIRDFGKKGAHAHEPISAEEADNAIIWTDIIIAWLYGRIEPITDDSKS